GRAGTTSGSQTDVVLYRPQSLDLHLGNTGATPPCTSPTSEGRCRVRIPLSYIARNLWTRRLTTLLTAGGLALVVFVFATVLMLDAGLKQTLVTTGELDNVVAIRKGSETEIQSIITREQADI